MTEDTETPREILRRMDLVMEQTEDKGTEEVDGDEYHRFGVTMRPNPERYEKIEEEDREGWYDTLDDVFIPIDTFKEAWESIDGMPNYFSPPEIGDMGEYTSDRREKLRNRLESGNIDYNFDNESTKVLEDLSGQDDPYFVIMVVDIVGSTNMNVKMHPSAYAMLVHSFIQEVRLLINKHRGYVLKYTGDGLIGYFPEPNMMGKHDNAILCASRVRELVSDALNPVFSEVDLPHLKWRVGLDTGSAKVFPGAQDSQDLLGTTVSLAAKIEGVAEPNEVLLGEYTEQNLHTDWRKQTIDVTEDRDWEYTRDGSSYSIYKLQSRN